MVRIIQPLLNEEELLALNRIFDYLSDEAREYPTLPPEERPNHIYSSVLTLRVDALIGRQLFDLGMMVTTPGALSALEKSNQRAWDFINRHAAGDWGDVGLEDWQANDTAIEDGSRLLSTYRTQNGERLWIITESDRSVTTLLLASEY